MRLLVRACAALAVCLATGPGVVCAEPVDVPQALQGWEGWALDGSEYLRCPYTSGLAPQDPGAHACVWPGALDVAAAADGARFSQQAQVYAEGWLTLPGDAQRWPQDVAVDGSPAAVVEHGGYPAVRLAAGTHGITGRLPWTQMPETIDVPARTGIVRLTVNGARIAIPERTGDTLRLGAVSRVAQSNRLVLRTYRRLVDGVPGLLETRLLLQVAGEAREEFVGPLLPTGFAPVGLRSALPARLDPDGRLRIQARPGTWQVELVARAPGALGNVTAPAASRGDSEVWSYLAADRLRVTSIEGAPTVDPAQANVPADWQSLPAFRIEPGATLRVVERSRGFAGQDLNRIQVRRVLWLDFDGDGYTFVDRVSGRMQQQWRLDMAAPYALQGARSGEQALLVTQGAAGRAGVELRATAVNFTGAGRIEDSGGALPATGWDTRLAGLAITLELPPGSELFAALGVDESPTAWLNRWRLLDIFIVLLVAVAAFRVAGWPVAVLAGVALTLSHHELRPLTWLFLNLLIAMALARAAPEGKLRFWARAWRNVAFALVLLSLVPFAVYQARLAFYPQLGAYGGVAGLPSPGADVSVPEPAMMEAPSPPPPPVESAPNVPPPEVAIDMAAQDAAAEAGIVTSSASASLRSKVREPDRYGHVMASLSYAPGTVLQSGPGVPEWSYNSHPLTWNGPVEPTQSLRLIVLGKWLVSVWRLTAVVLLCALFVVLARGTYRRPAWPWLDRLLRAAPTAAAVLFCAVLLAPRPVVAETPSPELLLELKARLTRPPPCAPACVALSSATVSVEGDSLEVRLRAHADTLSVLQLPAAPQRWSVDRVTVDGAAAPLARDGAGNVTVAIGRGVHAVVITGLVADAESVRLAFPMPPGRIGVSAPGWDIAGVEQGRLIADSLTLTRASPAQPAAGDDKRLQEEFPPFVRVHRRLALDLDWTATTTVERIAPQQGAFTLELPLLPGESVLTPGLPVRDGRITVSVPAGVGAIRWNSTLKTASRLQLSAPVDRPWVETWQLAVGPIWHVAVKGTPEVVAADTDESQWAQQFEPRPGESLDLDITRPAPVAGATVAFDRLAQTVEVGRRSTDTTLELQYRSTQGGRHVLRLPPGARLQSVATDGEPLAIRDENGELALPLQPGGHRYTVAWQQDSGAELLTRPGATDLGAAASNVQTMLRFPESRWILFATGGGVGPAILYWSELALFVVVAVLLGRIRRTPLATHEWLLVGLGLSTFSWSVLLLFAVWVFALEWRRRWSTQSRPWAFNAVQVGLALLTVAALGSLVSAIPNGLLGTPDMRIDGSGSSDGTLYWFHDRIEGALPQPAVLSVSIWFYKAAILAWALWLSFALVRWVRWAWDAYTAQRLWHGPEQAKSG